MNQFHSFPLVSLQQCMNEMKFCFLNSRYSQIIAKFFPNYVISTCTQKTHFYSDFAMYQHVKLFGPPNLIKSLYNWDKDFFVWSSLVSSGWSIKWQIGYLFPNEKPCCPQPHSAVSGDSTRWFPTHWKKAPRAALKGVQDGLKTWCLGCASCRLLINMWEIRAEFSIPNTFISFYLGPALSTRLIYFRFYLAFK